MAGRTQNCWRSNSDQRARPRAQSPLTNLRPGNPYFARAEVFQVAESMKTASPSTGHAYFTAMMQAKQEAWPNNTQPKKINFTGARAARAPEKLLNFTGARAFFCSLFFFPFRFHWPTQVGPHAFTHINEVAQDTSPSMFSWGIFDGAKDAPGGIL